MSRNIALALAIVAMTALPALAEQSNTGHDGTGAGAQGQGGSGAPGSWDCGGTCTYTLVEREPSWFDSAVDAIGSLFGGRTNGGGAGTGSSEAGYPD